MFRTATSKPSRVTQFAPNLPAAATKPSPGVRKYAPAKTATAGMAATTSADLFKMRIPEPDADLTGEALAKAIPETLNRKGTVYADQYLADKCPPEFDELQRRQFFCVLDLRRLKYTANEIFLKKDWKLNIINFAKEYEKSRGLIMLRYGLYEFKNVKPSEEVLKRWRAAHGLPDPDPEPSSKPVATAGSTKRKAEEDLQPKDNTLMASTANQNKRRNVEQEPTDDVPKFAPTPMKSKRKADESEDTDENQPNKLLKATGSAAKSKLESIINRVQSGSSTPASSPLKRPLFGASANSAADAPPSLFGITKKSGDSESLAFASKPNPFAAPANGMANSVSKLESSQFQPGSMLKGTTSVLSGHKIGSTPATKSTNIFSYLSESSSSGSGNENNNGDADAESDTESEHESEPEMGSQEAPASYEPSAAASTGTATPPIQGSSNIFGKPASTSNPFAPFDKPGDSASKGGIFGRVSLGSDGQPLRAVPTEDAPKPPSPAKDDVSSEADSARTPARAPGNFTYKPGTPINFASSTEENKEPEKAPASSASSIFGKAQAFESTSTPQPSATPLFRFNSQKTSEATKPDSTPMASSSFANPKLAATHSAIFGAAVAKPVTNGTEATASIFGASSNGDAKTASTPLFGGFSKPAESDKAATNGASSIFGPKPADASTSTKHSFGDSEAPPSKRPMFGAPQPSQSVEEGKPLDAKPIFGGASSTLFGTPKPEAPASDSSIFGGSTNAVPKTSFHFGCTPAPAEKKPEEPAAAKSSSIFNTSAPATGGSVFNFGSQQNTPAPKENPSTSSAIFSFGGQNNTPAANGNPATSSSSIFDFGGNQNAPAVMFGDNNTQANGSGTGKIDFNFSGGANPASNSTPFSFGGGNQDSSSNAGAGSFTFTAGGTNPFASTNGGSSSTPTPSGSFNFQFGGQGPSTPNPPPAAQNKPLFGGQSNGSSAAPLFSFTGATPSQNASTPKPTAGFFSGLLQPGGGSSNGASSPFPVPSSMNTTPINGTPEPQTQPEDGEEGPQEQISLTNGGPGEEDEVILHEVRAKAIKFIPIIQGADEEDAKKSPWSTQGIGPLRVLKNKTTGTVRILLRAEPRGHIAMNKALLADVEYKADQKTLKMMAASDDGSTLETWVLQVKTPQSASELAGVLEANKAANKK